MPTPLTDSEALTEARINIAKLEAIVQNMGRELGELKTAFSVQSGKLDQVLSVLSEAKGGGRTLMLIGGTCMSLGAAGAWVIDHLLKR